MTENWLLYLRHSAILLTSLKAKIFKSFQTISPCNTHALRQPMGAPFCRQRQLTYISEYTSLTYYIATTDILIINDLLTSGTLHQANLWYAVHGFLPKNSTHFSSTSSPGVKFTVIDLLRHLRLVKSFSCPHLTAWRLLQTSLFKITPRTESCMPAYYDWYSRSCEARKMVDMKVLAVAYAFYDTWITRYDSPNHDRANRTLSPLHESHNLLGW